MKIETAERIVASATDTESGRDELWVRVVSEEPLDPGGYREVCKVGPEYGAPVAFHADDRGDYDEPGFSQWYIFERSI